MANVDQLLKTNAGPEIAFTLSSTEDIDKRNLIAGHDPIIIGRASKHEGRGVQAKSDNAAFNCPVVSREHAIIDTEWNEETQEHDVIIKDKASLHGTFINRQKITPNVPYSLRDGDVIELGTNVARDNAVYQGVTVVFKLDIDNVDEDTFQSGVQPGYSVPSESEAEHDSEFEYQPYDDEYPIDAPTSVNTSPLSKQNLNIRETEDDTEMIHGSQREPIDLDTFHSGSLRQVYDFTGEQAIQGPTLAQGCSSFRKPADLWQSTSDLKLKTDLFSHVAMQYATSYPALPRLPLKSPSSTAAAGRPLESNNGADVIPIPSQNVPHLELIGGLEAEQQLPVTHHEATPSQYDADLAIDDARSDGSLELGEESSAYETRTPKSRTDSAKVINKFLQVDESLKLPPINALSWHSTVGLGAYMPSHTATAVAVGEDIDEQHEGINLGNPTEPATATTQTIVTDDSLPDHGIESTTRSATNDAAANIAARMEAPSHTVMLIPASSSDQAPRAAESDVANAALGKKRKHEQALGPDAEDLLAGSSLRRYARAVKQSKTHKSTAQPSALQDMRKYALGAALGAAGTFTLLASPLGGKLVDWASTL